MSPHGWISDRPTDTDSPPPRPGEYDLSVIISAPSIHEISDFVGEKLATLHGVRSTATHVIMRRFKEHGVLLDGAEEGDRQASIL